MLSRPSDKFRTFPLKKKRNIAVEIQMDHAIYSDQMFIKGVRRDLLPKLLLWGGKQSTLISEGDAGVCIARGSDVISSSVYRFARRAVVLYSTEWRVPVF